MPDLAETLGLGNLDLGRYEVVLVDGNTVGIRADGTGSTGGIFLSVTDSTVSGNSNAGVYNG